MYDHALDVVWHAVEVIGLVFLMMVVFDFIDVRLGGKLKKLLQGGLLRQYVVAAGLGTTPGCVGCFMGVTMYMHGALTIGAIAAAGIATLGDEAFVLIAQSPETALLLLPLLFVIAIPAGAASDWMLNRAGYQPRKNCELHTIHHAHEHLTGHYLREHVWNHICKRHMPRIAIWILLAMGIVEFGLESLEVQDFIQAHPGKMIIVAVLIGLIPASGPHLVFLFLFAENQIPFSVLLANAIAQNGHGLLPLLSYSFRDAVVVKGLNLAAGLLVGSLVFWAGW